MAGLEFSVPGFAIACTSTVGSKLGVKAASNHPIKIFGFYWSFDGTDSTKGPGQIEMCNVTFATNGPGANSTSVTPVCTNGRTETIQSTGGKTWTTEPTVVTAAEGFTLPSYMGTGMLFFQFARPWVIKGGEGFVLRITLPATVTCNFSGSLKCEE